MIADLLEPNWNPAYQLKLLLDKQAIAPHASKKVFDGWQERLAIPSHRRDLVLYALGRIGELPDYTGNFMKKLHGDSADMYTSWIHSIGNQLKSNNFDRNMGDIDNALTPERRGLIDICSHQIQEAYSPPVPNQESWKQAVRLRREIDKCIEQVSDSGIDPGLRQYALKHLHIVERAIVDLQVTGYPGGNKGAEALLGQAALSPGLAESMSNNSVTKDTVNVLGKFIMIVQAIQSSEYLLEKAGEIGGFLAGVISGD